MPEIVMPDKFLINDNMVILPDSPDKALSRTVKYGPNIKNVPTGHPLENTLSAKTVLKVGDNITTDHIMPAGAKILPYRSNVPYLSKFCFSVCDTLFSERCLKEGGGFIVGGANYGQGSSREHAALVPLYLGIRAVITKSFARMHKANLINSGIIPLTFKNEADYDKISQGDELKLEDIDKAIASLDGVTLTNVTTGEKIELVLELSQRAREILFAGGMLNYTAAK